MKGNQRGVRHEYKHLTDRTDFINPKQTDIWYLASQVDIEARTEKYKLNFGPQGNPYIGLVGPLEEYLPGCEHPEMEFIFSRRITDPLKLWKAYKPRFLIIFESQEPVEYYHPIPVPIVLVNCREQFQFDSVYCSFKPLAAYLAIQIFYHYQSNNPLEIKVEEG